ncbi:MAG: oxygen-independent coproporphyrinogen III oxidase, partial [Steroidobacteraceae bacterium]
MIRIPPGLLDRHNLPSPRYTSYPTVMHWGAAPAESDWLAGMATALQAPAAHCGIYVHIPFCQSLCTYCGCNMRLARNHALAAPYVATVLREFTLYRERLGDVSLTLGELHLGGGSPTYLPAATLDALLDGILQHCRAAAAADFAVEVDPRNTTREQLQVLRRHGFNRLSIGVQDFDARVLEIVNRVQTEDEVRRVIDDARDLGFTSISFDLIFGLPLQTPDSLNATFDIVDRLHPERISFLPYAHVPWIKPSQRRYTEADLPDSAARQQLFELGRQRLGGSDFVEIGMDQYARRDDALARALAGGTLSRNFMGFSASATQALIGLGVSAIGDNARAYAQNDKNLQQYETRVLAGQLPVQRGHALTAVDLRIRALLWDLLTTSRAAPTAADRNASWWPRTEAALRKLQQDGLIQLQDTSIVVTELGRTLLRLTGMAFDQYLSQT